MEKRDEKGFLDSRLLDYGIWDISRNERDLSNIVLLRKGVHFRCLPNCGLCCSYKVPLLNKDIKRLDKVTGKKFIESNLDSKYLRKENQFCIFLGKDKRCSIYEYRPTFCRIYPFIRETYYTLQMDFDLSCPGIGMDPRVRQEELRNMLLEETELARHFSHAKEIRSKVGRLEKLLKQRGIFTSPHMLRFITTKVIEDSFRGYLIKDGLSLFCSRCEKVREIAKNLGNIEMRRQAENLIERIFQVKDEKYSELKLESNFLRSEFSNTRSNTQLKRKEAVRIYNFSFDPATESFVFSHLKENISLAGLNNKKFSLSARKQLARYIEIWISRQIVFRFSHSQALSTIVPVNIVAIYLDFFRTLLKRIYIISLVIAEGEQREVVKKTDLKESIRASDNLLRNRCRRKVG